MLMRGPVQVVETTLLEPKLALPAAPAHLVHRPRLIDLLNAGAARKVTFVIGPAGFGKTVLTSVWLSATSGRSVGWVSLDASDDAPSRFWTYVLAALSRAGANVPAGRRLVAVAGSAPPEEALGQLVNTLTELRTELFLVLDDYHLITDPVIHRDLTFLVNQQLAGFHLVILSRTEPPLSSARWKAHGQVTEIRARSLAFTREEAATFLNDQGVVLSTTTWESLYSKVDGWVAALQLVALWSGDDDHHSRAITEFAAGNANIADYLTSEVLGDLPSELRRFLLWTSILPRLKGSLCDAVVGGDRGAEILRDLFRRGLFLESLDGTHEWFRYHQLFAELLRNELDRRYPEMVAELHRRASSWSQAHGLNADAIDHSIRAADWASVQRLMLGEVLAIGTRYEPAVVERWLDAIPPTVLRASPFFQLLYAFVLGHTARMDEAQQGIDRATELMAAAGPDTGLPELSALVSVVAAGIARMNCDLAAAQRHTLEVESALVRTGRGDTDLGRMSRAAAGIALATTLFFHGRTVDAEEHVIATARWTDGQFLVRMHANGTGTRALILAETGRLRQAETTAREALDVAASVGITELFQANCALLATAVVAFERGEDGLAAELLEEIATRADRHADRGVQSLTAVRRSQLAGSAGDVAGGLAILERQRARWPGWAVPTALRAAFDAAAIRLILADGDIAAAETVLTRLAALDKSSPVVVVHQQLAAGYVHGAQRQLEQSLRALGAAVRTADVARMGLAKLHALIQSAVVHLLSGHESVALRTLGQALLEAQEEGVIAPFTAMGRSIRPMLLSLDTSPDEFSTRAFRHDLLARLGVPAMERHRRSSTAPTRHPLTDREVTVLRLLSGPLSNAEIATSLGITVNTLKTHTRQIYSKLGVSTREDAIHQASILMAD